MRPMGCARRDGGSTLDHVQTKREIEELLGRAGLRPRKRFGQHFLIDGNLMRRLADSAELQPDDVVLEVGAGTGGLTDLLANRAGRVVCVEIDMDLFSILSERFGDRANVELICGDVLEQKHRLLSAVGKALRGCNARGGVKLVSNLPYDIATPLLMNLLVDYPQMSRFCFTVQAEVGDRITAQPGTKAYGPLSILARTICTAQTVARIGPQSFWPRPLVDSVMLRLDRCEPAVLDGDALARFSSLVRGVFEHRRKTLRSALGYVVDDAARELVCAAVGGSVRPEQIGLAQWLELLEILRGAERNLKSQI